MNIIRPSLVPQLWVHKYGFVNVLEVLPSTQGRGAVLDKTGGMTPPSHLTAALLPAVRCIVGCIVGLAFPRPHTSQLLTKRAEQVHLERNWHFTYLELERYLAD